jgi:insulysin
VDSEHEKNIQNDIWRTYQLSKVVADQSHPYAKFSTGNITTLKDNIEAAGINLRDAVMDFYMKNYSANNSKLVIYGKETIEEMLDWTNRLFSDVLNRDLPTKTLRSDPYPRDGYCGKMVSYKPVVDKKNLSFIFPLPSIANRSRNPPQRLLSHLIGHESKGSLLELLKANNYANALAAYCEANFSDFALFKISIDLTDHGTNNVSEVIAMTFSYIGMLREGIPVSVSEEIKKLEFIDFLYTEKVDPSSYVTNVVSSMLKYHKDPLLLFLPAVLDLNTEYACQLLTEYLVPANCIIFNKNQTLFDGESSKSGETTISELYYKINYFERAFSEADVRLWEDCVSGRNTSYRYLIANTYLNLHLCYSCLCTCAILVLIHL